MRAAVQSRTHSKAYLVQHYADIAAKVISYMYLGVLESQGIPAIRIVGFWVGWSS